jgi:hypothetical protein|tara:strand:+ start:4619 stop:4801 length:183 start_codon:yes stop_codon:yes gene_type:complete
MIVKNQIKIYRYVINKYYKNSHYKYDMFEVNYYIHGDKTRFRKSFRTKSKADKFYKTLIS